MAYKRFTVENHTVHPMQKTTYRIPGVRVGDFHVKSFGHDVQLQGDLVNKLGRYEDLGDPDDIARILATYRGNKSV